VDSRHEGDTMEQIDRDAIQVSIANSLVSIAESLDKLLQGQFRLVIPNQQQPNTETERLLPKDQRTA
jgi:hypothetical protein